MQGTGFLFGYLGGGALPFAGDSGPAASFILAFKILPLVLVISAIGALLFYWGVVQRVVGVFAGLLRRTLGIDGALALGGGGACLRRHDRGAAADPAVSGADEPGGGVRDDDVRDGGGRGGR